MNTIESLKWRASVRNFDTQKEVTQNDIERLIDAANLAATSMGLQPFKLVIVKDKNLQKELVQYSYGQEHVGQASHLLVFAIETDINQETVDAYIQRAMDIRNQPYEALEVYENSLSNYIPMMD